MRSTIQSKSEKFFTLTFEKEEFAFPNDNAKRWLISFLCFEIQIQFKIQPEQKLLAYVKH
jgi:hypothetical protein